jgi:hypothetical protein
MYLFLVFTVNIQPYIVFSSEMSAHSPSTPTDIVFKIIELLTTYNASLKIIFSTYLYADLVKKSYLYARYYFVERLMVHIY